MWELKPSQPPGFYGPVSHFALKYVKWSNSSFCLKGGQAKCVRLRTRGEEGCLILAIFVRMYYVDDPYLASKIAQSGENLQEFDCTS